MNITILGTGAMACLFAAKLAPLADITMLGSWKLGLTALQQQGIWLEEEQGEQVRRSNLRVPVTHKTKLARGADLALVLGKSYQNAHSAQNALEVLTPQGVALSLQNGLGNLESLQATLGVERAYIGVTTQGARLVAPGAVRHAGGGDTWLAVPANAPDSARTLLGEFAELCNQAGLPTQLTPNVESKLWEKLIANAGINALTALLRVPNGELLERPSAKTLLETAVTEAAAVAIAMGITVPTDVRTNALRMAELTASNHSSMLQDVENKRPNEVEAINGAIERLGTQYGVPTPVNSTLAQLLRALLPTPQEETDHAGN